MAWADGWNEVYECPNDKLAYEIRTPQFKIGDTVRVKPDLQLGDYYEDIRFTSVLRDRTIGRDCIIESIVRCRGQEVDAYHIEGDRYHVYSGDMFILVKESEKMEIKPTQYYRDHVSELGYTIKILRNPKGTEDIETITQVREWFVRKINEHKFRTDSTRFFEDERTSPVRKLCAYDKFTTIADSVHFNPAIMNFVQDVSEYQDLRIWDWFKLWFPNLKERYRSDITNWSVWTDELRGIIQRLYSEGADHMTFNDVVRQEAYTGIVRKYLRNNYYKPDQSREAHLGFLRHNCWFTINHPTDYDWDNYGVFPIYAMEIFRGVLWEIEEQDKLDPVAYILESNHDYICRHNQNVCKDTIEKLNNTKSALIPEEIRVASDDIQLACQDIDRDIITRIVSQASDIRAVDDSMTGCTLTVGTSSLGYYEGQIKYDPETQITSVYTNGEWVVLEEPKEDTSFLRVGYGKMKPSTITVSKLSLFKI